MTRTLTSRGYAIISQHRKGRCQVGDCREPTTMALVVPCTDIGPDGTEGMAAVRVCAGHVEESLAHLCKVQRAQRREYERLYGELVDMLGGDDALVDRLLGEERDA